ncbi:hypothetical protein EYF80_024398 [Liparis tanakae]|uniref:Uncharacterized protein n=1 Tax=Liparis tanakae TaxID=230148 RepID=A0A4Z2HKG3_9TELE|nr:hypothetical protein EYF80_024398 [Liparis tanakae]
MPPQTEVRRERWIKNAAEIFARLAVLRVQLVIVLQLRGVECTSVPIRLTSQPQLSVAWSSHHPTLRLTLGCSNLLLRSRASAAAGPGSVLRS